MTFPLVQFVDAPDSSATTRFDFNERGEWMTDDGPGALADGWSLGAPSFSGDPDAIGSALGFRQLTFRIEVAGYKSDALAVLNELAVEAGRQRNWLLFQLSPTSDPVWFHTYRTLPSALSFDRVQNSDDSRDHWEITVTLDADAWAVGEQVTLGPTTVDHRVWNGVAVPTNSLGFWLPRIRGDMAVPLQVTWGGTRVTGTKDSVGPGWLAVSPTAQQSRPFWALTAGVGTRIFAGAVGSAVYPGKYRVMSVTADLVTAMRFGVSYDGGSTFVYGDWQDVGTTLGGSTDFFYDLGEFTFSSPPGTTTAQIPYIKWEYTGVSTAYSTTLVLVPILDRATDELASVMTVKAAPYTGAVGASYYDAFYIDDEDNDHRTLRGPTTGTVLEWALPASVLGASELVAYPQHENLLSVFGSKRNDTTFGYEGSEVTVKYRPRYLFLSGDA